MRLPFFGSRDEGNRMPTHYETGRIADLRVAVAEPQRFTPRSEDEDMPYTTRVTEIQGPLAVIADALSRSHHVALVEPVQDRYQMTTGLTVTLIDGTTMTILASSVNMHYRDSMQPSPSRLGPQATVVNMDLRVPPEDMGFQRAQDRINELVNRSLMIPNYLTVNTIGGSSYTVPATLQDAAIARLTSGLSGTTIEMLSTTVSNGPLEPTIRLLDVTVRLVQRPTQIEW